eukprot:4038202-Amphidinium_carterae.1
MGIMLMARNALLTIARLVWSDCSNKACQSAELNYSTHHKLLKSKCSEGPTTENSAEMRF